MDLYDVAQYFDDIKVYDAYSSSYLFTCQMDQYDATTRDSMTGWRRTCSAPVITVPARRVIRIQGFDYICGQTFKDFFKDRVIREHLLMHPSDGLFTLGTAREFIDEDEDLTTFHGAVAVRKEVKEEGESSQFFAVYNIYLAMTETAERDLLVRGPDNIFYRIQSIEVQTGKYRTLFVSELGMDALTTVVYTPAGAYDVASDTTTAGTAKTLAAVVERYQTNYRYLTWAAEKFRNGDIVVTVSEADLPTPKNNDRVLARGRDYRVLEKQQDGFGSWELQCRPANFNLVVET